MHNHNVLRNITDEANHMAVRSRDVILIYLLCIMLSARGEPPPEAEAERSRAEAVGVNFGSLPVNQVRVYMSSAILAGLSSSTTFAHHHARIEIRVEMGAGAPTARRCCDRAPVALGDLACPRCLRVRCHGGIWNALAQARQGAVLTLAKQARLGAG